MKLDRRDFLKRGGLLALFGALPKAVAVGMDAVTVGVDAAKEHVLQVFHKHVNVPVDALVFEHVTGVPFLDMLLSIDRHPTQRLACSCEYTLDGKCANPCDEARRLMDDCADRAADFFSVIAEHVDDDDEAFAEVKQAWRGYEKAEGEYRKHYCTGWVTGEDSA